MDETDGHAASGKAERQMSAKDIVTLSFSGAALLVSLATAYFNFWPSDDVQVRVAAFEIENTLKRSEDGLVTTLAFVNRGNRPVLVTAAEWVISPDDTSGEAEAAPCDSPPRTFPFVLEKGALRLVTVTSPREHIESNWGRKPGPLHYGVKIASISAQGTEHGSKLMFATLKTAGGSINAWTYGHAIGTLFDNTEVFFRIAPDVRGTAQPAAAADRGSGG